MDDLEAAYAELLGAVSHDLRNPLSTLVMAAQTLQSAVAADDPKGQRVLAIAERIQRQTVRLARLADTIADFGATRGGALALTREPHPPAALVEAIVDAITPIAAERELAVTGTARDDAPIECDRARVGQAVAALAQLAVKVAPKSSPFTVVAQGGSLEVTLALPGLDDLERVFEPTWRSPAPGYKSAPLLFGLARGLMESHGGAIRALRAPDGAVTVALTFVRR